MNQDEVRSVLLNRSLSIQARAIYWLLSYECGRNRFGVADLSLRAIAHHFSITERKVTHYIKELCAVGVVDKERFIGQSNTYKLPLHNMYTLVARPVLDKPNAFPEVTRQQKDTGKDGEK